ncbi:ferrous iron transport protein B [Corynebacterium hansenii]|uniref:Ferrous iron transport protein B n=1 Tax=Corynebacterium hansenii TaxID=394964 RepID=A0ABV7ZRF7_9CORY|nr:ferrous iron transport protein B [Corynebacterium hansenii]WJY99816.1 Ferrous iron transport protein B [Corynebacterium hansenii]
MNASPKATAKPIATAPSCHACAGGSPAPSGSPVIGLVGAPNSGKSTLFNALTGAKAQMGNWPGTTVEVSRGAWRAGDVTYDVIDFPGAYSLDAMSPDEELTREMLINREPAERPDLVIVAVDATAPARGLYLFSEIAEHPYRIVVALTKTDVAAAQGVDVDAAAMQDALGVPVVAVDPRRRARVDDVRTAVAGAMTGCPRVIRAVAETDADGDPDAPDAADEARFAYIDRVVAASTTDRGEKATWSDRIDRVALNPLVGPLLFLGVMWVVFQITTVVAAPLQDGLESLVTGPISDWARSGMGAIGLGGPVPTGLVVDGLIGGVGMVLTFAPLMALMFLCLAVLEDSGYMARAAVVTDRVMRAIGLPGKAFIPLIVGFGCNVPAISATRVLGNPRHRVLTALLIPFTSCSARLTVYVMLAAVFFPGSAGTVVFLMYLISIGLVVLTGLILRHTLWRAMPSEPLVIDLPGYQLPMPRLALSVAWTRLKGFLRTAGGIIVVTVVAVWALMSVPVAPGYGLADENLPPRDSAYGAVSETVAPVFAPAGFGSWSLTGTLLTGFVAKEAVISTWAQTYAVEDVTDSDPDEQRTSPLAENIRADFDETSGGHGLAAVWAFMIFLLAYTPCVATLAAQKREIGLKWTLFGLVAQLLGAWLLAVAVFQVLRLFL